MEKITRLITSCACIILALTTTINCNRNEKIACKPRSVVVTLNNGDKPSFIEIQQCSSANTEPKQRCAAIEYQEVSGLKNHTKCSMRCSCNHWRLGECNDTHKYDIACPFGSKWDFSECECKPSSPSTDNKPNAGCGKGTKDENDNSIPLTMFILALVIELIVVLVAVFLIRDACKYRRRETGVFHKTAELIRTMSNRPNEGNMSLRKSRSDTGSESFLNTYSASQSKIDHV